jgi:hypothetical protein
MRESNGPRVFEEGTITQVIGPDGFNLYIGALCIKHIQSIQTTIDTQSGERLIKIRFRNTIEREIREIEENVRIAKTLSWIEII